MKLKVRLDVRLARRLCMMTHEILSTPVQEMSALKLNILIAFMCSWKQSKLHLELMMQPLKKRHGLTVLDFLAQFQSVPGFKATEKYQSLVQFFADKAANTDAQIALKTKKHISCGNVAIPTRHLA